MNSVVISRICLSIKSMRSKLKPVKISLKCIDSVDYQDIELFSNSKSFIGAGKGKNDTNNKKRENLLIALSHMDENHPFLNDFRWKNLRHDFHEVLLKLYQNSFDTTEYFDEVIVKKAAGRSCNFDFSFTYLTNEGLRLEIPKVEFKNERGGSISRLPQLLSLQIKKSTRSIIKGERYDSFFYDNFLDSMISSYKYDFDFVKPDITDYEKCVGNTNYDIHPMFRQLYDNEHRLVDNHIVDISIHAYLNKLTIDMIDFEYIEEKLKSALSQKQFVMWDGKTFNLECISDDCFDLQREFKLKQDRSGKRHHTIIFACKNGKFTYHFLLRWRNHKGILNPAWQISCVSNVQDKQA